MNPKYVAHAKDFAEKFFNEAKKQKMTITKNDLAAIIYAAMAEYKGTP